jgi:hypothetical protein
MLFIPETALKSPKPSSIPPTIKRLSKAREQCAYTDSCPAVIVVGKIKGRAAAPPAIVVHHGVTTSRNPRASR